MKKIIETHRAPSPIGPYSQAVRIGNLVFTSGQIAIDPVTQEYRPLNIIEETVRVMENLRVILESEDFTFDDVVKTSIFLADMKDFTAVNDVYSKYFSANFPARETVQVSVLPRNARIEISMIAGK